MRLYGNGIVFLSAIYFLFLRWTGENAFEAGGLLILLNSDASYVSLSSLTTLPLIDLALKFSTE